MLTRLWYKFFKPTVAIVRVETPYINSETTANVTWRLSKINKRRTKGVALYIDTNDGSLAQSEIIKSKIKVFCEQNKLPLYTFAGRQAVGPGYHLLSIGDKIYASENSMIGGVGLEKHILGYSSLYEKFGIEERFLKTKEFLYRETRFGREPSETGKKVLQDVSNKQYSNFIKSIKTPHNNKQTENLEKIFGQNDLGVVLGKEAVQSGIVHELGTYEYILRREFPNARGEEHIRLDDLQKIIIAFKKIYKISTSRAIPIIFVTYMIVSTVIELWLVYASAQYASSSGKDKESPDSPDAKKDSKSN